MPPITSNPDRGGVPVRPRRWGTSGRAALLLLLADALVAAATANPTLTLAVSNESAPAGGWAQIKVFLAAPQQITAGGLSMDFDPSVFGDIANVAVFSATGDAAGYAHVNGVHVDAHFSSPSGGIGQLPGLPVLVVSIPVLAWLPAGRTAALAADPSGSVWTNTLGSAYSVAVTPAAFQVGGSASIQSVTPAGGLQAAGTVVQISGAGFDSSTVVTIDGVSIASALLVSSQQMNVTLGGATEMTGKRLLLTDAAGDRIDYFLAMPGAPSTAQPALSTEPFFLPITTYKTVEWEYVPFSSLQQAFVLQNQTLTPVTVTFFGVGSIGVQIGSTITIPPGQTCFLGLSTVQGSLPPGGYDLYMTASAPIRALAYSEQVFNGPAPSYETTSPPSLFTVPPQPGWAAPGAVVWNWQTGTSAPAAAQVNVSGNLGFTVSVPASAQQWLSVTPTQGAAPATITLTPDVSSLGPGTYTAVVALNFILPPVLSEVFAPVSTIQVALNVSASPFLSASDSHGNTEVTFSAQAGRSPPIPQVITVGSSGAPTPFTAAVSTTSGGNWLSATPATGTAPGSVTLTVNPAGLAPGSYTGLLAIQGLASTVTLPVTLGLGTPAIPPALSFVLAAGASTPVGFGQLVVSQLGSISAFSIQTQSGGNWLSAAQSDVVGLTVSATASGLGPGTYQGSISIVSTGGPIQVPVTLTVLGPPATALTVTPSSLFLTASAGQSAAQSVTVSSASGPAVFSATVLVTGASSTVTLVSPAIPSTGVATLVAPASLQVQVSAPQPGTYYGSVLITWDGGSVTVPLTLSVAALPDVPPVVAAVVNAASEITGAIAPGEIFTVFGMGIGGTPSLLTLDAAGKVATMIGGTQVLVNGTPAPLIYASASQINAVVPYEVGSGASATIQVASSGLQSGIWEVLLAQSASGLFTVGSTGVGQAAVLNQDSSVNSASNPAARGTVVQIFGTGGGQTIPANATGGITPLGGNTTVLPVTVTIGGADAMVTYHGSAPLEVAGVLQVNAVVSQNVVPGPAVPILVKVGDSPSQTGVTIAVQ